MPNPPGKLNPTRKHTPEYAMRDRDTRETASLSSIWSRCRNGDLDEEESKGRGELPVSMTENLNSCLALNPSEPASGQDFMEVYVNPQVPDVHSNDSESFADYIRRTDEDFYTTFPSARPRPPECQWFFPPAIPQRFLHVKASPSITSSWCPPSDIPKASAEIFTDFGDRRNLNSADTGIHRAWLQSNINLSWIHGGNGTIYTTSNGGDHLQTNNGSTIHDNNGISVGNDLVAQQQRHFTLESAQQGSSSISGSPAQISPARYRAHSVVPAETIKGQSPPPEPPPEPIIALSPGPLAHTTTTICHERLSYYWSLSWKDCLIFVLLTVLSILCPEMASSSTIFSPTSSSFKRNPQPSSKQFNLTVESVVTKLLVSVKQLLEALTDWSNLKVDENYVSDVYVRLGSNLNAAVVAFGAFDIDISELLSVPDDLRNVLEQCLSQDANAENLELYLPAIRGIITNLLQDLRRQQAIYRRIASDHRYRSSGQATQQIMESREDSPSSRRRDGASVGDAEETLVSFKETDWRMKTGSGNNPRIEYENRQVEDVDAKQDMVDIAKEILASLRQISCDTQQPSPQDDLRATETTTTSIPLGYPYNLPPVPPPSSPRTTRRLILRKELPESLRSNLLWSRQLSQAEMKSHQRRSLEKEGIYLHPLEPSTHVVALASVRHLPDVVQLNAKKQSHDGVAGIAAAPAYCDACSPVLVDKGLPGEHTRRSSSTEFGDAHLHDIGGTLGDMYDFCLNCSRDLRSVSTKSLHSTNSGDTSGILLTLSRLNTFTGSDTARGSINAEVSLAEDAWNKSLPKAHHHEHKPTCMGDEDTGTLYGLSSKHHNHRTACHGLGNLNIHDTSSGVRVEQEYKQKAPADYVLPQYLSPNHRFLRHERRPAGSYFCGTVTSTARLRKENHTSTCFAGVGRMEEDPHIRYPSLIHEVAHPQYNRRSSASSDRFGDPRFQEASCRPFNFSARVYIEWQRDPIDPRAGIQCAWLQFIVNLSWIRGGNGTIYTTSNGGNNPQTNNGSIIHDNSGIPAGNDLVIQQQEHYTSESSEQVPSTSRPAAQIYSVHYGADSAVPPETAKGQSPPPEPPPESMTASQVPFATTNSAKLLAHSTTASHERVSHHCVSSKFISQLIRSHM
ncbi:Bud site selection protein 6 [Paramarasmius palmivorus]|uniref:Bud site selection protein 6 n=1 Tax=Paramarasmius palmivorus TaxID=297713 RepID=A0AAW0BN07_9AGAR